jgi:short-subunit dehydrogenase
MPGTWRFGPAEAFTPEQFAQLYDVNVLSTQRVNRAVLPHLRRQKQGLVVWVSSSSSAGGTPPYLAPYFAAKAGMDAMAVSYARELARWGIETSIIVPGAFTAGTNHFAHSGRPADEARVAEYEAGPNKGLGEKILEAFGAVVPPDADASAVAEAIVNVVDAPFGKRRSILPAQENSLATNLLAAKSWRPQPGDQRQDRWTAKSDQRLSDRIVRPWSLAAFLAHGLKPGHALIRPSAMARNQVRYAMITPRDRVTA